MDYLRCTVFANGIWKSGNNMLLKLLKLLGLPEAKFGISSASLLSEWYAVRRIIRGPKWGKCPVKVGLEIPVNVGRSWLSYKVRQSSGSCFGGHAAYSDHFLSILKENEVRPVQIIRDPRDIICSFAHWIDKRPDYYAYKAFSRLSLEGKMLGIIEGLRYEDLYFESLATVLDRSYGWITRPSDVLVIRFEDLVGPQGGGSPQGQAEAVERVVAWAGVENADIKKTCKSLFADTATFRKGKKESWKEDFTPDVTDAFNRIMGGRLKQWGYE